MKVNLLFCLLSVAVITTGCNISSDLTPEIPQPEQNDLIQLNGSMGGVAITKAETVRDENGFLVGDLIGVTAIFSKKQATTDSGEDVPSWGQEIDNRHFTNIKATATAPVTPATGGFTNKFDWTAPQFYPQGRNIFLYAYYPYHDGSETPAAETGVKFVKDEAAKEDILEVTLKSEAVTDESKALTQPDVMVASHAAATASTSASIFRKSPETDTRLVFRHLLAQLQFSICKEEEVVNEATIKSITVYMPPKGAFPIGGDDALTLGEIPKTEGAETPDYTKFAKYTFTPGEGTMESIPVKTESKDDAQFVFITGETPFMTLPLTVEQLKANCKIELEINLGEGYGTKTFEIKGDMFTAALKQGHRNTINFTINYVLVTLTATVTPWGTEGSSMDIPIE